VDKDTIWEAEELGGDAEEDESPPIPWDDQERRSMRCRKCDLPRVFRRRRTRHSLHFILAIGTLGIWLPVWGILILLQRNKPWTCPVCGVHQRS